MVFSSLVFVLAFLPLNLLFNTIAPSIRNKNFVMLAFSLVFYAWGEPVYVLLLIGMSFFCWLFSMLMNGRSSSARRLCLIAACFVCLGMLGYFKYSGFFVNNINSLFGTHISFNAPELPIGISFYTFQLLSYVVDVYRGDVPPQKRYYMVLLYAGLFHQCVAGPIVRYADIENALIDRHADMQDISNGITRFSVGLAKKALLANTCGSIVDTLLLSDSAMDNASLLGGNLALLQARPALALWVGAFAYMLQIYLDFSAYSDMAIGMGQMTGFRYLENFNYPYIALSIGDFWRRWHISLSTFFRDYVYIPLGGNRRGTARTVFNLFVVWALTGLWHGASWNFIFWGLYYFIFLVAEKFFMGKILKKLPKPLENAYVLIVVFFGWILFKFTDTQYLAAVLKGLFCANGNVFTNYEVNIYIGGYITFFIIAVIACTPLAKKIAATLSGCVAEYRAAEIMVNTGRVVFPVLLIILSCISLVGDTYNPFLYFQF